MESDPVQMQLNQSSRLWLRPDSKLIAAGLSEVEPATARKAKNWLYHFPARSNDLGERRLKVLAVEDDQRTSLMGTGGQLGPEEASIEALACKGSVVRTVVHERPAECLLEKALGRIQITRGIFDVVDFLVQQHSDSLGLMSELNARLLD